MSNLNPKFFIKEGDLVQLVGEKQKNFIVRVKSGEDFQTHLGIIPHDELIGKPWGIRIQTHKEKVFRVLQPALDDLLRSLNRQTQIMYPKDIGYVLLTMGIGPGKRVIEAGTGSGALTIALANTIGDSGIIYSYDAKEAHQSKARANLKLVGMDHRVEFKIKDVKEGFDERNVDALFLDLPQADEVIPHVRKALMPGGFFGCILPTVNQVEVMITTLKKYNFDFIEISEILHRYYKPTATRLRPVDKMNAHTGYLLFARRITSMQEQQDGFEQI